MKPTVKSTPIKSAFMAVMALALTAFIYFAGDISFLLKTSVVGFPEHEPFDGTHLPVEKVPDWVHTTANNWDLQYSDLSGSDLIDIPEYDPSDLRKDTDDLTWGNSAHDAIRNAKITFSVPYMGNYKLDGKENAGSHLAVDMKIPEGTPIYAVANGTVVKTSEQTSGFGHHIVLVHNNAPSIDDEDDKETLYSSYSHLSKLYVDSGDVIEKGDRIALSGSTGTATTPHLHFQIDNEEAPWHPYWPFTWSEAQDEGLDFFSAVNEGLGREKALETTINPMEWVQEYLDGDFERNSVREDEEEEDEPKASSYVNEGNEDEPEEDPVVIEEEEEEEEEPVVVERDEAVLTTFDFIFAPSYYKDVNGSFQIMARDQYGDLFDDAFPGNFIIKTDNGNARIKSSIGSYREFDDGIHENGLKRMKAGSERIIIEYEDEEYVSDWFDIIDPSDGLVFTDLDTGDEYYEAVMYLVEEGVISGYPDGTFRTDNTVSRVEALKLIYKGLNASLKEGRLPFDDVSDKEWYSPYLYTAYKAGVVDGYSDGSFRPTSTVNKAEFYKMLFNGMGVDINPVVTEAPFEDVSVDDWYAPYVAYAKEIGIIDSDIEEIEAANGMSRGEVAYAIYKLVLAMK